MASIKIFNTLTRTKEEFVPHEPGKVAMYVCGPTVYDRGHLGHGRSSVAFDVIRRFFMYQGFDVKFVSNYTDIDDKMITRAAEKGITVAQLAADIIPLYKEDFGELRVLPADVHPMATEYTDAMISLISELEKKDCTYMANDGVYFDITKFPEYGKLSGQNLDELQAGSRVAVNDDKRNPQDFVLWKLEKPGEPAWESPWGRGRPGWHIECSAMVKSVLGQPIDIHGGGLDLIFPHHECEVAQSEAAYGVPFSKYWVHNGFVNINKEKMSKSLNNFVTLRESFKSYPGRVIRYLYLLTHYRSPLDFSEEVLEQAKNSLARIDQFWRLLANYKVGDLDGLKNIDIEGPARKFDDFLSNDFDVPGALGVLFSAISDFNEDMSLSALSQDQVNSIKNLFLKFDQVLAILPDEEKDLDSEIQGLIDERETARKAKDFAKSDEIRDALKARGIVLEDTPNGVMWKRV
ncbi:MAG: cysteine--tRNA ligase [Candidatus Gracilibacteria bacterium]